MSISRKKYYHIIDMKRHGTIYNLLYPLCKNYENHKLITYGSFLEKLYVKKINKENDCVIFIHTTGSLHSKYLFNFNSIFINKNIIIFLHVSPKYLIKRGRKKILKYFEKLSRKGILFVVPSPAIVIELKKYNINAFFVQLGIEQLNIKKYKKNKLSLMKYYNRIITTCTSGGHNDIYFKVKGIDIFCKIMRNCNLLENCLIAGTNVNFNNDIICKSFKQNDFLNILYHSKMYIQCSRYESYNITAIQAKKFKKPVLLLDTEGTSYCMNGYVFKNNSDIENEIKKIESNNYNYDLINELYYDSLRRENLDNFKNQIEKVSTIKVRGIVNYEKNIGIIKL